MMKASALFVDDTFPLTPGGAVAAILIAPDGRFLLQLRDDKPGIFYPDHWGCFGGALEPEDETPSGGLRREIREELGLDLPASSFYEFTEFTFDFSFAGRGVLKRKFYISHLTAAQISVVRLGEGADVRLFDSLTALTEIRLIPYDSFALWLYHARDRLRLMERTHG